MTVGFGMELDEDAKPSENETSLPGLPEDESVCVGCGSAIYEPFIMHVQPDLKWHGRCLKCHKCKRGLSDEASCFMRNGKAYCREDYCSNFLQRCAGCLEAITNVDLVLRIRGQTFHVGCFRCVVCSSVLQPGEEIAYHRNLPYCLRDAKLSPTVKYEAGVRGEEPVLWNPGSPSKDLSPAPKSPQETVELMLGGLTDPEVVPDSTLSAGQPIERKVLTLLSSKTGQKPVTEESDVSGFPERSGESENYFSPQRTRSDSTSSSLDGPLGENDVAMTPNTEGSQDDDCNSLMGCMTSAVSCMSGGLSGLDGGSMNMCGLSDGLRKGGTDSGDGSISLQSSLGGISHVRSCAGSDGVPRSKNGGKRSKEQKTTRVRTVLNEKQLHMLRTCYAANPRPDALMKEQLVEMTSLSPRVIRVWFQNKRCKDKKKQIMIKQMEQHHQSGIHPCGLQGVPMVAGSPIPNDSSMLCPTSGVDVQRLPGPMGWKEGPLSPPPHPQQQTLRSTKSGLPESVTPPCQSSISPPPHHHRSMGGLGNPVPSRFSSVGLASVSSALVNGYHPHHPQAHLFTGMLPPISQHNVDSKSLHSPNGLMGDDGSFPAFQQLISTFDLMEPMLHGQRGMPAGPPDDGGLTVLNGPRFPEFSNRIDRFHDQSIVSGGPGMPPISPQINPGNGVSSSFVFAGGDHTFTTLRPINLRPSLST